MQKIEITSKECMWDLAHIISKCKHLTMIAKTCLAELNWYNEKKKQKTFSFIDNEVLKVTNDSNQTGLSISYICLIKDVKRMLKNESRR